MKRLGFMNSKTTVDEIIAGEYSPLSDAQPFLTLLSSYGWHYMGTYPPNGSIPFASTNHVGEVLKCVSDGNKAQQRNVISNFLGVVGNLVAIHNDQFSLNSLKKNTLGLFTGRVAINLFYSGFNPIQGLPPLDDEQKFKNVVSMINTHVFENFGNYSNHQQNGEARPLFPSELEARKKIAIDGFVNWFNSGRIKEYAWLPLQKGDEEVARWCWNRIKALQEKEKIALAFPPLQMAVNLHADPFYVVSALESACGDQYQLAVYAYFCFVADSFTREMLRNKIAGLYRAKKFKTNNKGKIINVTVSDKCKEGLDRLTKYHNKKQADMLSELIEKACKELSDQE